MIVAPAPPENSEASLPWQSCVLRPSVALQGAVAVITPEMRLDADFRLAGRVNRFERLVADGSARATIELEFNLVRIDDHELLLLKTYREEEDVAGSEIGDSVEAFSRALHRILERLAADLPEA